MGRKKKGLEYLQKLLSRISQEEINSIKQYLKCFDPNFDESHKVKTLELLELILEQGEEVDEDAIIRQLYPQGDSGGYKFLRLRLLSKIYEGLLLEVNTERKGLYTEHSRTSIDIKRKLIQIRILWGRGIMDELPVLLRKVERKARKFELYDDLVEALHLKQQFAGYREGLKEFEETEAEIREAESLRARMHTARRWYNRILLEHNRESSREEFGALVRQAREEVGPFEEKAESSLLSFYQAMVELEYHQYSRDFEAGSQVCQKALKLLDLAPELFSRRRRGILLGQHANHELFCGNFARAVELARKAAAQFPAYQVNHALAREVEFFGLFYQDKLGECEKLLLTQELEKDQELNMWQVQRRRFLLSALWFAQDKPEQALDGLREVANSLSEYPEWNASFRLLSIMVRIDLKHLDEIELNLDSARKQTNRLVKRGILRPRFQIMIKLLIRLIRQNFDYDKLIQNSEEELAKLASNDPAYCWEIKSPELTPFHEWLKKNAERSA